MHAFNLKIVKLTSDDKNDVATAYKACSGQGINQSIIALLTRPGKFLHRVRNVSPTGDIAKTICKLFAHFVTKYCQTLSLA